MSPGTLSSLTKKLPCSPMGNACYSCDCDSFVIEWIIGVAASIEGVKSMPVVSIQRQPEPDTLWQVGIREEMPSECDQIRISLFNGGLGGVWFKTPSRNDRSHE